MADGDTLLPEHFSTGIQNSKTNNGDVVKVEVGTSLKETEKLLIQRTLAKTGGNKTKTAEILGIGIRTLYRKIEEYNL